MPGETTTTTVITDFLVLAARILKFFKAKGIVRAVRTRACKTLFARMHNNVLHKMREFAIYINNLSPETSSHVGCLARDTVTACRDLMSDLLEMPDHELHCCFKVIVKGDDQNHDRVVTFARSEPQDHHHDDNQTTSEHFVNNNSIWSALMCKDDGKTKWARPYSCFSCNDLRARSDIFQCSRTNWEEHYRSTLVFPLRYLTDPVNNKFTTIGFLSFYSLRKDAFYSLPDIFDYTHEWDGYHSLLSENAVFQLGACLSDTLSTFLRPTYEGNNNVSEKTVH